MAGRFDGKVWLRKNAKGLGYELRRVDNKTPKDATLYTNSDVDTIVAKLDAAKAPLAPYSCFIPGVSPTGKGEKAVAHTMAQVKSAIKKGSKPVICYAQFGGACLMLLEDKPLERKTPAARVAKKVEFL